MILLNVTLESWNDRWMLAGISVVTVFAILIILVLVLRIFGVLARDKKTAPAVVVEKAAPLSEASEAEKAAVAVALYLYQNDSHDEESGVLTIAPVQSAWHSVLNPRL